MPLLSPGHDQTPDLSVIILNWNARKYLVPCLESILGQEWQHSIELIVVDNNSNIDDSIKVLQYDYAGKAKLILNKSNVGFSHGNNQGWRISKGRYVLFLNPDTIVEPGALDYLIDWMEARPEVGAIGPRMTYAWGELQNSSRSFPSFGAGLFRNSFLGRLWPNNPWSRAYLMQDIDRTQEHKADWLSGSAIMLRRESAEAVNLGQGPWDESYFMYCEDMDLCYRLNQKGWPSFYVPGATIQHHIGKSSDWAQGAMIRRHHHSMLRFYMKHYAKGPGLLLAPIAVAGIGMRALFAVFDLYRRYAKVGMLRPMIKRRLHKP